MKEIRKTDNYLYLANQIQKMIIANNKGDNETVQTIKKQLLKNNIRKI